MVVPLVGLVLAARLGKVEWWPSSLVRLLFPSVLFGMMLHDGISGSFCEGFLNCELFKNEWRYGICVERVESDLSGVRM